LDAAVVVVVVTHGIRYRQSVAPIAHLPVQKHQVADFFHQPISPHVMSPV
jgi:hypothetical protein